MPRKEDQPHPPGQKRSGWGRTIGAFVALTLSAGYVSALPICFMIFSGTQNPIAQMGSWALGSMSHVGWSAPLILATIFGLLGLSAAPLKSRDELFDATDAVGSFALLLGATLVVWAGWALVGILSLPTSPEASQAWGLVLVTPLGVAAAVTTGRLTLTTDHQQLTSTEAWVRRLKTRRKVLTRLAENDGIDGSLILIARGTEPATKRWMTRQFIARWWPTGVHLAAVAASAVMLVGDSFALVAFILAANSPVGALWASLAELRAAPPGPRTRATPSGQRIAGWGLAQLSVVWFIAASTIVFLGFVAVELAVDFPVGAIALAFSAAVSFATMAWGQWGRPPKHAWLIGKLHAESRTLETAKRRRRVLKERTMSLEH